MNPVMRVKNMINGGKMCYVNISYLKMPWAILLVALTISNAIASTPAKPPAPPPTIAEMVGGSTDVVVGHVERFFYRGISSRFGPIENGREYDEDPADKPTILEAVVRVNRVLHWKPTPESSLSAGETDPHKKIRDGDLIRVQFWEMNKKNFDMVGVRKIFILRWFSRQIWDGKFYGYTSEKTHLTSRSIMRFKKLC